MTTLRQKSDISFALWIPLIWYAIVASRFVGRWMKMGSLDLTEVNYLEGNPIDKVVFSALIIIGIFILLRRKDVEWSNVLRVNAWIFILFLYMGLSILWSDFMMVSLKRWIRATGALVMVLVVLTESNPLEAISTLFRRCFYVHIPLSIIFIKYYRTIGVGWDYLGNESWLGVTTHKNHLGQIVMTSGIFFIWSIIRTWNKWGMEWIIYLSYLLMSLFLLNGSRSKSSGTSLFVFFAGIVMLIVLHLMRRNLKQIQRNILISIFVTAFFFLIFQFAIESFVQRPLVSLAVEASGHDETFTGRTYLWMDVLKIASHHPIVGVGYGSFWIGDLSNNLWEKYAWKPQQGHNGYIDVYVELGLIGVCLLIIAIYFAYKNIMKTIVLDFEYGRFTIIFLTMILIHNITETSFLRSTHNLWFLLLLVSVKIPGNSQFNNSIRI